MGAFQYIFSFLIDIFYNYLHFNPFKLVLFLYIVSPLTSWETNLISIFKINFVVNKKYFVKISQRISYYL